MNSENVRWTSQSRDSSESTPVGGHDVGCNVWVQDDEILIYLQQGGGFDENSSMLKQGRLRVHFDGPVFGAGFLQELHLDEGFVRLSDGPGGKTRLDLWVDTARPVLHLDGWFPAATVTVTYENWRIHDRVVDSYSAELFQAKEVWMYPGTVTFHRDTIEAADGRVEFYHRNRDEDLSFDKEMDAQGLAAVKSGLRNPQKGLTTGGRLEVAGYASLPPVEGVYGGTPYRGWPLVSPGPVDTLELRVTLHTAQTDTLEAWRSGLQAFTDASKGDANARETTQQWWRQYWDRSHIRLVPENRDETDLFWRIGRNARLFRYLLGCNASGTWPTKFNGGLFTFDPVHVSPEFPWSPDYRRWSGGTFTTQNQRLLYWPMLKSGDFDLMPAFFQFFLRLLTTAQVRVLTAMGAEGAIFPEQVNWYGLCATVDHGWTNTTGLPVPQIKYLFSNQLEVGLIMLEHCRFTGANVAPYLDFCDQTLRFYNDFYRENEEGKMVLEPSNALETYHPVRDPADAIAGLEALLERLLALPEEVVGAKRQQRWAALQARLPALPTRVVYGRTVLAAARTTSPIHNCELPQLYPVFPYGRFGLEKPGLQMAIDTALYTVETEQQLSHISWQNAGIAYARLGMKAQTFEFLKRKLADGPHRFPAFWGPGHDWTPDHNWGGSGLIQLQEMLLQTPGRQILLFPCWDANLDVDFKLHAPFGTVVDVSLRNGSVVRLVVDPPERLADVQVLL